MIFDAAIIGTGPAGVSAALTLKANNKSVLWIGSRDFSDKVAKAEKIANLPGCFAAGDCTGRPYQYAKAVGEGNVAAHSMIAFLAKK